MHYRGVLSLTAAALSTSALAFSPLDPPTFPPPTLPPTLTPLFTLDTVAGDLQAPIPLLLSGYQGIYPLLEGTISGPALNGTIHHGTSYPHVTDDGMFAFSHRHYCGKTDDGKDFVIQQQGVGYYLREQTWLGITIGGEYAYLRHVFMLAQNDIDVATKIGKITVYGVNMQDQLQSLR